VESMACALGDPGLVIALRNSLLADDMRLERCACGAHARMHDNSGLAQR
jgi:hypothetical protein